MTGKRVSNENKKTQMKKRTKFTIISIINIIWYTVTVLVMSYLNRVVPSELTVAWFSAWTVELALLYGIKVRSKDSVDYGRNYTSGYTTPVTSTDIISTETNTIVEGSVSPQDESTVCESDDSIFVG